MSKQTLDNRLAEMFWYHGPDAHLLQPNLLKKYKIKPDEINNTIVRQAETINRTRLRGLFLKHNADPKAPFKCYIVGDPLLHPPIIKGEIISGIVTESKNNHKTVKEKPKVEKKEKKQKPKQEKVQVELDFLGMKVGSKAAEMNAVLSESWMTPFQIQIESGHFRPGHFIKLISLGFVEEHPEEKKYRLTKEGIKRKNQKSKKS